MAFTESNLKLYNHIEFDTKFRSATSRRFCDDHRLWRLLEWLRCKRVRRWGSRRNRRRAVRERREYAALSVGQSRVTTPVILGSRARCRLNVAVASEKEVRQRLSGVSGVVHEALARVRSLRLSALLSHSRADAAGATGSTGVSASYCARVHISYPSRSVAAAPARSPLARLASRLLSGLRLRELWSHGVRHGGGQGGPWPPKERIGGGQ